MLRYIAFMLTLMLVSLGTSLAQGDAKPGQPATPSTDKPTEGKAAANRNSSGAGGIGGMSTSGAGTGGMTTEPSDGTGTSKPKPTSEPSRPQSQGAPEVPDAKNKDKRKWE